MTSNQPSARQGSRWGSFLSGAVAGLESRLDTILTDDSEASAKSRAAELAIAEAKGLEAKENAGLQPLSNGPSRSPSTSKSRPNDRLQERLAKALVNKSGSQAPSEVSSPALRPSSSLEISSPRTSLDSRPSVELVRPTTPALQRVEDRSSTEDINSTSVISLPLVQVTGSDSLQASNLPINPARHSEDGPSGVSVGSDVAFAIASSKSSLDFDTGLSARELQAELIQLKAERDEANRKQQEEMDTVLERVDALQAKLQYLAKETVAAAREANGHADRGSLAQKLAEKDERIALLMEEGTNLSKNEMRYLGNVRKLNAKIAAEESTSGELRRDLARVKKSESEFRARISRLEQATQIKEDMASRLASVESDFTAARLDLNSKQATIVDLRRRLALAEERLESSEKHSSQASLVSDTRKIGDLEEALAGSKIEMKLAEDRLRAENQCLSRDMTDARTKAEAKEMELSAELKNLEARMEALRFRAEEASSDQTGDSQAKLLRQIETLQTQSTVAADNWRTIEGSLNARLTAIEKERDEAARREADIRKKARDLSTRCRKLENELETSTDKVSATTGELTGKGDTIRKLEAQLATSQRLLDESRREFEQQRQTLEANFATRIEEERSRQASMSATTSHRSKRTSSPSSVLRKSSTIDHYATTQSRRNPTRPLTSDSFASLTTFERNHSRRPSALQSDMFRPPPGHDIITSPTTSFSIPSRKQSAYSLAQLNGSVPGTPSDIAPSTPSMVHAEADDDNFDGRSSAQGAADVISASTVHTGPSVALVERMSASIRRLEAEKAGHKEEVARLLAQRDEARESMVGLMREAEDGRGERERLGKVEGELEGVKGRYEALLEMLGEREEEVEELRGDLVEMKRIYKELASQMGRE